MKKFCLIILCLLMVLNLLGAAESIDVYIDGEILKFDVEPEIVNNRTMVPLKVIFDELDMEVKWDGVMRKVTATKENLSIELTIDSDISYVNGKEMIIDSVAYIKEGRTMVPLAFLAESTGADVMWNDVTKSVYISRLPYPIVDTGLTTLFSDDSVIFDVTQGSLFYGQDGHYTGKQADYIDNGNGTILDTVTGLMWQKTMTSKMDFDQAVEYAADSSLGGYSDWRIPTIKELFSLILYTGQSGGETANILFIDTDYFDQPIGDTSIGEREIDAQTWSSTKYVGKTMHNDESVFGVNFIDGRIKAYPLVDPRQREDKIGYFRLVRGNESYGKNQFVDNGDGTISDLSTGLMWQLSDDGHIRNWSEALTYVETLELAEYDDWRLPNIKELQSIVDYSKSLQTTGTPAIDNLFKLTPIKDPNGEKNYGYYWSSTTHQDGHNPASNASYVSFGEAKGEMFGSLLDVHGCGAVRSDPKSGDVEIYPTYFGPQGDLRYVFNYTIAVRELE